MTKTTDRDLSGWLNALLAFGWWGFIFPSLLLITNAAAKSSISNSVTWSMEILSVRIVWCLLFCLGLLWVTGRLKEFQEVFKSKQLMAWFLLSSFLILLNWMGFILGAATKNLSQTSLGYYMGPIFNVLLGYLFLGERLRLLQYIAVGCAGAGIIWLTFQQGGFPWIALCLAASFGCYGLVRKKVKVDSIVGLTVESLFCIPVAIILPIIVLVSGIPLAMTQSGFDVHFYLFLTGPATAVPLICFAVAAKRLRLGTLGFIQFIAPTGQLILARFANGEAIPVEKMIGYVFVWIAVAIYLLDLRRQAKLELNVVG